VPGFLKDPQFADILKRVRDRKPALPAPYNNLPVGPPRRHWSCQEKGNEKRMKNRKIEQKTLANGEAVDHSIEIPGRAQWQGSCKSRYACPFS
jgi:hypothetical protein